MAHTAILDFRNCSNLVSNLPEAFQFTAISKAIPLNDYAWQPGSTPTVVGRREIETRSMSKLPVVAELGSQCLVLLVVLHLLYFVRD